MRSTQQIIQTGGFVHTVFFWLKDPQNQQAQDVFLSHLSTFINASDYVKSKHIGRKQASTRDVVDSSYDFCLVVTFENQEEHDLYQSEPAHLKFVENAAHLWAKVKVYDSLSVL